MSKHDINKAYVSPIDKFLYKYDETHPKTLSQLKEIYKNKRIAIMRDDKDYQDNKGEIWEEF